MILRRGIYGQKDPSTPVVTNTLIPGDGTTNWIDTVGAVTTSLGKIIPSSTATGWDKGASFGFLPSGNSGYLEFDVFDSGLGTSGFYAVYGLAETTSGGGYNNIDYGFYCNAANTGGKGLAYIENGVLAGFTPAQNWAVGDTLRVDIDYTPSLVTITWKLNGSAIKTTTVASIGDLYFDCSINRRIGAENLKLTYNTTATNTLIPDDGTTAWTNEVGGVTTSLGKVILDADYGWNGWNKGASFGFIPASTDGYLEFNLTRTYTGSGFGMFGLSNAISGGGYTNIDNCIYFNEGANTNIAIFENGSSKSFSPSQTWSTSDLYSIERVGTYIYYKKNGVTFYTSLTASTLALFFDCSLSRKIGAENLKLTYNTTATNTLIPGDGTTNWTDTVGAVTTSLGKIIPSSTVFGWNKGASFGFIPSSTDGYLEFNLVYGGGGTSGGYSMFGLSTTTAGGGYSNINYAIYINNGTGTSLSENGTVFNPSPILSHTLVTDLFRIERIGTTIYYKRNGTTFYTSLIASSTALYFDCSINRYLGAENLKIEY